jgi:hypothetical protein
MNAAHSKFSYLYCKISKHKRYDADVAPIIYQSTDARCLQELHECAKKVKMNYGVLHRPIFNIELNKVDK